MHLRTSLIVFILVLVAVLGGHRYLVNKQQLRLNQIQQAQKTPSEQVSLLRDNGAELLSVLSSEPAHGAEAPAGNSSESGHGTSKPIAEMTPAEYKAYCEDFNHLSIYAIGSKLSCPDNSLAFYIAVMIATFLIIVIEVGTHKLESIIRNVVHTEILNKVYKELMMMGLISFIVVMLESIGFFEIMMAAFSTAGEHVTHESIEIRVKIFEFVHITIFVLSIFYVIAVCVAYLATRHVWRKWSTFETSARNEAEVLAEYNAIVERYRESNAFLKVFNVVLHYRFFAQLEKMNYWSVRSRFVKTNRLKTDFRFDLYLKMRIYRLFVELIEVSWVVWSFVFLGGFFNTIRSRFYNINHQGSGLILNIIFAGYGMVAISAVIYLYLRIAYAVYVNVNSLTRAPKKAAGGHIAAGSVQNVTTYVEFQQEEDQDEQHNLVEQTEEHPASPAQEGAHTKLPSVKRYFPFFSPRFTFFLLQVTLLLQAFYMAFLWVYYFHIIIFEHARDWSLAFRILVFIFANLPGPIVALTFFPFTLSPMTILSSVDSQTSMGAIATAYDLQRKRKTNVYVSKHHHSEYFHTNKSHEHKKWTDYLEHRLEQLKKEQQELQGLKTETAVEQHA